MRKKKNGTASTTAVSNNRSSHFDQAKMIALWGEGKSIQDIAKDQGCSPVYARRVLSTKAPEQYEAGLAARHTAQPGSTSSVAVTKSNGNGSARTVAASAKGEVQSLSQAIDVIARAVASSAFSEAQLVPKPITRNEMYANITKGVRAGVKKLGIGFHA